ncbi:MAG: hypothetical protein EBZ05_07010, partial [Verrucomicrobia bacterium]|nr:hypothetical protein [Verrucomicrobiota bacterium]
MAEAAFTVTVTLVLTGLKLDRSFGVNTTAWLPVAFGTVAGALKAKTPGTLAMPPLRTELLNACPRVIAV